MYSGMTMFSFYSLFQSQDHFNWGAMILTTFVLAQVAVTQAALSGAHKIGDVSAVTAFSSLYFIFGLVQSVLLYTWRFEFISVSEGSFDPQGPAMPSGYDDSATYQNV